MEYGRVIFTKLFMIVLALSVAQTVYSQVPKGRPASVTGTILGVSQNYDVLTLFEKSIRLTNNTVVLHEDGRRMRALDLRPGLLVSVEAGADAKGLVAKRIVIQKMRRE